MTDNLTKGAPIPASLGAVVDLYAQVRDLRLDMEKEAGRVAEREAELKEHLIERLGSGEDSGVAGQKFRAHVVPKDEPKLDDWATFCTYVAVTGHFDLLQKRFTKGAVTDRWEAGEAVPGIGKIIVKTLSVTKIPGR